MSMDPTTLVTFLFKAPPEARTVELLGSWDNFRQPYRMHNDRRRGAGFWSGCFKFHNIIFDGDKPQWTRPRTGGLKQGGTYWYYYRLDDDIEAYDDSKECTTSCPLLPGQTLNLIEVPMEVDRPCRSRSASFDVVGTLASMATMHTLDPGDKFAAPDPPPISKVHARCRSDLALNGRLENVADPTEDSSNPEPAPISPCEHTPIEPCTDKSIGRFYAHGLYADDRSSSLSRRSSWSSTAPSSAHSLVVDLYGVESQAIDETGLASFSLADVPQNPTTTQQDETSPREHSEDDRSEDENDNFDLWSPTYSAATVSSTGGVNTPYRLSVGHHSSDQANPSGDSIENVAERLRSLSSTDYDNNLPSPIIEEGEQPLLPFTGYALPTEAVQSTQSLDNLSSGKSSTITALPTIVIAESRETSLTDSIFGELSFVGAGVA